MPTWGHGGARPDNAAQEENQDEEPWCLHWNESGVYQSIVKYFTFSLHKFNFFFQLDTEPEDPIKLLKSVEEEKKKEKERIARNVSLWKI